LLHIEVDLVGVLQFGPDVAAVTQKEGLASRAERGESGARL
jgi:hypothetical protein